MFSVAAFSLLSLLVFPGVSHAAESAEEVSNATVDFQASLFAISASLGDFLLILAGISAAGLMALGLALIKSNRENGEEE